MKIIYCFIIILCLFMACSDTSDYYPLTIGNEWIYHVARVDRATLDTTYSTLEIQIGGEITHHGRRVFQYIGTVGETSDTVFLEDTGDYILRYDNTVDTVPDTVFAFPLEEGKTWTVDQYTQATVVGKEMSAGLNGLYQDCWRIDFNFDNHYYAPDVGLVRLYHMCSLGETIYELEDMTIQ